MNKNLRLLSLSKDKHIMEAEKATQTDDGETEMVVGGEAPMTKDDDGFGGGNGGVPSATTKTNGKVEEKKNSIHQIAPEEAPFAGGGGDVAAAAARVAAAMAPVTTTTTTTAREQQQSQSQCLPIRILEDFDVREKADEKNLVALTSAMKPSDLVVFGKARKVEGGENELPSTLLMKKLQPQLRPPHPLKLVDVLDWCVSYDEVEGGGTYSIWLVTPRAWYKLGQPGAKYAATFAQTRRRAMFASVFKKCIEEDWECSFTKVLEAMKNAPRVDFDVKVKKETLKEKKDNDGTDGESEEEEEEDDEDDEEDDDDDDDDDEFSYSEKEIKKDGFFVCSQVEHLVKSGVLLPPGTEASRHGKPYTGKLPRCLISFSRWTMIANRLARQKKDRMEMEMERKERAIQRAMERAERKELRLAQKEAAKEARAEARALALKKSKEPVVIPPRIADPTKCSRAIDEFPWASPAIVGEVLSLWDVASVYETIFYVPTTTLRKFAHAFLSNTEDCTPSDDLLVQDVIVGAIRAIEARADAVDSSETTRRNSKLGFTEARSIQDPTIGLQDLAALNWRQLAIDMITEFLPSTPCNPRVRTGAQLAVQKLQELMMYDADNVYASDLDAGLRVSLASALVIIAADSEGFHEYEMQKIEEVRDKKRYTLGSKAFDVGIPIVIPEASLKIPIFGGAKQEDVKEEEKEEVKEDEKTKPDDAAQLQAAAPDSAGKPDKRRSNRCGHCHTCMNRQLRQACLTRRKEDEAMGIFPASSRDQTAEVKAPVVLEDPNMRRPKDDDEKRMLWTRQAMRWYRDNDDRQIWRHGRPVAVDARGRRYFQLGGRNGSGMLFVESPLPSWHVKTPKSKEEKKSSPEKVKKEEIDQEDGDGENDEDNEDNDSEGEEEKEVEPAGPPVDDGEYTDNYPTDLPVANTDQVTMDIPGVYESASNWGVVYPNEELIELAKWCDPNYPHEKYICRWANLVSRSALGETYDDVTSEKLDEEETRSKFKDFLKSIDGEYDGYAKIDEKCGSSKEAVFGDAHAKALKLVSVAQYLLHSTPFWVQDYRWTEKFLECDQELTNIIEHAPEAVVLQRLMKAFLLLEACCRTSQVMDPQWQNSRQSWIAKVKKFIKKSPEGTGDGSAKDEDFCGDDEAMMDDNAVEVPLNVTSAASLLHKLVVLQLTDPARLSAHTFAFSDPEGLGKHASQIKTGDVVMLCMNGYRDTKKAHLSDELIPPHFVDTTLLRDYERCIVRATAFRGAEEHDDGHVDEPWAWFLLELID